MTIENNLFKNKIERISGIYEISADTQEVIYWQENNIFVELSNTNDFPFKANQINPDKQYLVQVEVLRDSIKIIGLEDEKPFIQYLAKYKYQSDGFLYLENTNRQTSGIPFIAGSIHAQKIRMSIDDKNYLTLDISTIQHEGLLFVPYYWEKNSYRRRYKKVK